MDAGAVLQMRVVLNGISPLIWRRLLVPDQASIADLHEILQAAFGWSDSALHQFTIHATEYGLWRPGTPGFLHDAHQVRLADFTFRPGERFTYTYDFFSFWRHDVRVEQVVTPRRGQPLPRCIGGARQAPPEGCRGAEAFLELRRTWSPVAINARMAEVLTEILQAPDKATAREVVSDHHEEMAALIRYCELDDFDQAALNRAFQELALDCSGVRQ